jgi:DNA-binding MarR family transcriptional regulator
VPNGVFEKWLTDHERIVWSLIPMPINTVVVLQMATELLLAASQDVKCGFQGLDRIICPFKGFVNSRKAEFEVIYRSRTLFVVCGAYSATRISGPYVPYAVFKQRFPHLIWNIGFLLPSPTHAVVVRARAINMFFDCLINERSQRANIMDLKGVVEASGRNWSILETLYKVEKIGEQERFCYVSGLAKKVGKAKSETSDRLRELKAAGLVELEQREGERRKYYRVSSKGKGIIEAIIAVTEEKSAGETIELEETDQKLLEFILQELDSASMIEARLALLEDLGKLCHRTRIWRFGDKVWDPIKERSFNIESEESVKLLNCLSLAVENMRILREENEIEKVKKKFLKGIEEAFQKSIPSQFFAFQEAASHIIKLLASENDKIDIYKAVLENVIIRVDIKNFDEVGMPYLDTLLDFNLNKDQKMDLRKWLYTLMENENETVRKKALHVFEKLRI